MTAEYNAGWAAHVAGEPLSACPHPRGSTEARRWCCGWYECQRDPVRAAEAATEEWIRERFY